MTQAELVEKLSTMLAAQLAAPSKPKPKPVLKPGQKAPPPLMTVTFMGKVLGSTSSKFLASTVGKETAKQAIGVLLPAALAGLGVGAWLYSRRRS
jgi:hypothetical protein